jgi:hypothetical protein
MTKELKYNYYYVIQGNFGYCGWEDMSQYNKKNREEVLTMRGDLKEYRASGQGIYRLITRREINPKFG